MKKQNTIKQNKIGLWAATIIGFNAMVGAGVTVMPAILAGAVGPAGILSLLFAMFMAICLGVSLGYVAHTYPGQGWSYLYPSKWAGHKVGLFSSFLYIFGLLLAMGVLVQQVGVWMHSFISFIPPVPLGISILLVLALIVMAGAQASSWLQYSIAGFVIFTLLISGIFGWLNFNPATLKPFMPYGGFAVFKAAPSLLFSFLGFEVVSSLYPIVKNPHRNVPIATIGAISLVSVLYFIFVFGILFAVPKDFFLGGVNVSLATVLTRYFPSWGILGIVVTVGCLFGIIGTIHSILWATEELLTGVLKKTKSKFIQTLLRKNIWNRKVAVMFCASIMLVSSLFAAGEKLVAITALFIVPAYTLSISALLFVKKEWKNKKNIITSIALIGGIILIWLSAQSALEVLQDFF